uniref:Uncharacterized protein n=1 Tax=Aegilops tauschii subsp. strangulata TaxID=200361 RepID=A0A453KUA5_AEGTS
MALFSVTMKAWIIITLWFLLAPIARKYEVGPLYVSSSLICFSNKIIIISSFRALHGVEVHVALSKHIWS